MIAPLALTLLLLAPQEPRPTAEDSPARAPQAPQRAERAAEKPADKAADKAADKGAEKPAEKDKEEAPVVTQHELRVGGRVLRYTVTTGMMPLKNEHRRRRGAHLLHGLHARARPAAPRRGR